MLLSLIDSLHIFVIIPLGQVLILFKEAVCKILLPVIIKTPELEEFLAELEIIVWGMEELVDGISESILTKSVVSICHSTEKPCL